MDFIVAVVYVIGVYLLLPMYFWGRWERQEQHRDPVRRRGIARIRRELARRERGMIDTDDASPFPDRAAGADRREPR